MNEWINKWKNRTTKGFMNEWTKNRKKPEQLNDECRMNK